MSLSSYLASKYLTAEPPINSKKRKRKDKPSAGLTIADDHALGWSKDSPTSKTSAYDSEEPLTVASGSSRFRRMKKNTWKPVESPAHQPEDDDAEEANRIIAAAARESRATQHADEDPTVLDDVSVVKMGDGTHAGLQRAAAVAEQFERRKTEELAAWKAEDGIERRTQGRTSEAETVYRDATGRRIDLSMRRADARREADERARKERQDLEAQKGDIQVALRERRREELDDARFMPVARKIDDQDMNRELKGRERWNDPAAQFLASKKKGDSSSQRPAYQGAAAPNRYGIRPGHKWDGVDRGNGWEAERFKALNRTTRIRQLDFAWQLDE